VPWRSTIATLVPMTRSGRRRGGPVQDVIIFVVDQVDVVGASLRGMAGSGHGVHIRT
jgi:hypothetical protein